MSLLVTSIYIRTYVIMSGSPPCYLSLCCSFQQSKQSCADTNTHAREDHEIFILYEMPYGLWGERVAIGPSRGVEEEWGQWDFICDMYYVVVIIIFFAAFTRELINAMCVPIWPSNTGL